LSPIEEDILFVEYGIGEIEDYEALDETIEDP